MNYTLFFNLFINNLCKNRTMLENVQRNFWYCLGTNLEYHLARLKTVSTFSPVSFPLLPRESPRFVPFASSLGYYPLVRW